MNLYGVKTIKVDRDSAEVLPRGIPSIGGVDFGSSPDLATDHTIYDLGLPSECDARILRVEKIHSCGTGFELSAVQVLSSALSIGVSMAVIGSECAVGLQLVSLSSGTSSKTLLVERRASAGRE